MYERIDKALDLIKEEIEDFKKKNPDSLDEEGVDIRLHELNEASDYLKLYKRWATQYEDAAN